MADWQVPTAALGFFGTWLGWPVWMREGTTMEGSHGPLPPTVQVRDDLVIIANLLDHVDAVDLMQAMMRVGQPSASGLGRLAFSSGPNLAQSIALTTVALRASTPYLQTALQVDGETACITLRSQWPLGSLLHFAGLCWMAFHYMSIVNLQPLGIARAQLSFSLPSSLSSVRLHTLFDCEVMTGADTNCIRFPAGWLTLPNPAHDPIIWALASERTHAALARQGNSRHLAHIRELIVSLMDSESRPPRLKQVAIAAGTSPRTIVRQLGESGTSFHTLVEEERRLRALSMIANPSLSVSHIAETLGFPDTSSFGRKFRSWFGESPARFRRLAQDAA